MTNDERAIPERVATWPSASPCGDLSTVLILMTDDVIFLVASQPPFGKKGVAERFTGMGTAKIAAISDIQEVCIRAYLRSHISMTITHPQTGKTVDRAADTLTIVLKEPDGRRRLARDANRVVGIK